MGQTADHSRLHCFDIVTIHDDKQTLALLHTTPAYTTFVCSWNLRFHPQRVKRAGGAQQSSEELRLHRARNMTVIAVHMDFPN